MKTVTIIVDPQGTARWINSDQLAVPPSATIARASHVEPGRDSAGNHCWLADMSPVGGPILGPYATRGRALTAELVWLASWLEESIPITLTETIT